VRDFLILELRNAYCWLRFLPVISKAIRLLLAPIMSHPIEQLAYSWMKPIAHTLQTMTNQMRHPVEIIVRNMETSSAPVAKSGARSMRESFGVFRGGGMLTNLTARRCGVRVDRVTTCQVATPRDKYAGTTQALLPSNEERERVMFVMRMFALSNLPTSPPGKLLALISPALHATWYLSC
jgi:hypothetical protein